jgi:hypothetical protein
VTSYEREIARALPNKWVKKLIILAKNFSFVSIEIMYYYIDAANKQLEYFFIN